VTTLIVGRGYLAKRLAAGLDSKLASVVTSDADITDAAAVGAALRDSGADAVINCAGKTGRPNVDWCQAHPRETYRSNVVGPLVLAEQCAQRGAYLLHLGSGCVFYGPSPSPGGWREEDHANPVSYYSRTKYAADLALSHLEGVGIARIRMPVDDRPHPRNLVTKLAGYASVADVDNSVTVVEDLVEVVNKLVLFRAEGVFHVTNPGTVRHRDLLSLYREYVDPRHSAQLVAEAVLVDEGLVAVRRSNCVLASRRLGELGIVMRPALEAVRDAVQRYGVRHRVDAALGSGAGSVRLGP
jgi:dTDP-4-dehydrorhamnose reductase